MTTSTKTKLGLVAAFYAQYGLTLRLTSGDRSVEEQDRLYRAGRTRLKGGESYHNFGRAADLVPGSKWPANVTLSTSFRHIAAVCTAAGLQAVIERDHVHAENEDQVEQ